MLPADAGRAAQLQVYAVHPGALPLTAYQALADALPAHTALAVLDLQQLSEYRQADAGGRTSSSVEQLARRLCQELSTSSRFTLLGWSFGGVIAFAMAEQLRAAGRPLPEQVLVLDSIAPVEALKQPDEALRPEMLLGWFAMYLAARWGRSLPTPAPAAGATLDDRLRPLLAEGIDSGALRPETTLAGLRKLYETYVDGLQRNNRLANRYVPQPARCMLTVVTAERSLLPAAGSLGWRQLAGTGLRLRTCPGTHYTLLTEPLAVARIAAFTATHRDA